MGEVVRGGLRCNLRSGRRGSAFGAGFPSLRGRVVVSVWVNVVLISSPLGPVAGQVPLEIGRVDEVRIDGVWTEGEWAGLPAFADFREVSPRANARPAHGTECRLGYDDDRMYFVCRATDADPESIRAFVGERDEADGQDYIGVFIDPVGDGQRAFNFQVSAAGVQTDALYDPWGGGSDASWDAIWESAAGIDRGGFTVEAAIPFRSLRFPAPEGDTRWRVFFVRHRPRTTPVWYRSFEWDTGDRCLLCQADPVLAPQQIRGGYSLEVVPTVVADRRATRDPVPDGRLGSSEGDVSVGASARWGITPDVSLSATVNPDFSQIEADAVQLEANTQFALQYAERRPFFLEGADLFATPFRALFTRSLAEPSAGTKLSGKPGSAAFGAMVVRDRMTNLLLPGPGGSTTTRLSAPNTSLAGRYRTDLGSGSSVGLLYTGRFGAGYRNQVVAADALLRPAGALDVQLQALTTRTRYPDVDASGTPLPAGDLTGGGAQLSWRLNNRVWESQGTARILGDDVRMDLGFEPRVGYAEYEGWLRYNWWGDDVDWYSRMDVTLGYTQSFTEGDIAERKQLFGRWAVEGPWQTRFFLNPRYHREAVDGQWFTTPQLWWWFWVTPSRRFTAHVRFAHGEAVDYLNVRESTYREVAASATLRVGSSVRLDGEHSRRQLRFAGAAALDASVSQLRLIYNFSARARVRLTGQYRRTDRPPPTNLVEVSGLDRGGLFQALLSYRVNPLTAIYVGYGNEAVDDPGRPLQDLVTSARGVFLKLGYAWRP